MKRKVHMGPHRNEMCDHWTDLTADCLGCEIDQRIYAERKQLTKYIVAAGILAFLASAVLPMASAMVAR